MLTHLRIRNFKGFDEVSFELGDRVVLVGPNNSGKTSALQALTLWETGLKRWLEKRGAGEAPPKRPGVTINRRDLFSVPVPAANLLWKNLHVRESSRSGTKNIRIDIIVTGVSGGQEWECGLEFDYANEESLYCRPLRLSEDRTPKRMAVPEEAGEVQLAFLPPMSGLTSSETRLDAGAINVRLGEGRTTEVLRNLCYQVLQSDNGRQRWKSIVERVEDLFGVHLDDPDYVKERGEILLSYRDKVPGIRLDISSAGRGLQQTLLLLAHLNANRGAVLMLDEPDAHLEILRQRQIYRLISQTASEQNSQIIAASHSEVVLNEAADRDVVIAFVGQPHRIDDRGAQVRKALKEIGFDQYYLAEEMGWVLYLEGATDLSIFQALASRLEHQATAYLERPFVYYVGNQPSKAREHFYGLREAKPDLRGIAIYDRLDTVLTDDPNLVQYMFKKQEIENYICDKATLRSWVSDFARRQGAGPLFSSDWPNVMDRCIDEIENALETLREPSPWGDDLKVTDKFLDRVFARFFERLELPNLFRKTDYHELAQFINKQDIDPEISEVLDLIHSVANRR